ncbi:hypothetical protein Tcan_09824 [Toxocara canis]|uniref:Uncharacterized protein n=1 Tax=Toxocara canis TaxID=6265 RepID=A0A0B2VH78_TOXCA|nr:hypothetical protein Tcan_09824 [Toxocara canis]
MDDPKYTNLIFSSQIQFTIFVICLHIAVVSLAAEVGNMIFRIITEIQKQNRIEKEQMPVLLADLDELGKDTVYRMTVDSITTESSIMHKSGIDDKKVASNISPEGVFDDDHEANAVDDKTRSFTSSEKKKTRSQSNTPTNRSKLQRSTSPEVRSNTSNSKKLSRFKQLFGFQPKQMSSSRRQKESKDEKLQTKTPTNSRTGGSQNSSISTTKHQKQINSVEKKTTGEVMKKKGNEKER